MDADALRVQANRTADQLAMLAAHAATASTATSTDGVAYAAGAQAVARWLSSGYITPALARLLADAEQAATRTAEAEDAEDGYGDETPGGGASG